MHRSLLIFGFFILFIAGGFCQKKEITVMFYNTENFFDTIDDPHKSDNEFLPESEKKWDTKKYFSKINNLGAVIDSVGGPGLPSLVGMCEVENETCVRDLLLYSSLKNKGYKFLVTNSPDVRSIDVALLFDAKIFSLISFKEINATNPETPENKTRNILYAKLLFNKSETLHVFVNHWPSMRGGEEESETKREYAAKQLKFVIDSIQKGNASAKIITMGDFNETPDKSSIQNILRAKENFADKSAVLFNPYFAIAKSGQGTHYYNKEWNVLDQVMMSKSLAEGKKGLRYAANSASVFKHDMVLYKAPKLKVKLPNRTFSGKKYHNGFSDHLPVFVKLEY